jgi:hypothetical protein
VDSAGGYVFSSAWFAQQISGGTFTVESSQNTVPLITDTIYMSVLQTLF